MFTTNKIKKQRYAYFFNLQKQSFQQLKTAPPGMG